MCNFNSRKDTPQGVGRAAGRGPGDHHALVLTTQLNKYEPHMKDGGPSPNVLVLAWSHRVRPCWAGGAASSPTPSARRGVTPSQWLHHDFAEAPRLLRDTRSEWEQRLRGAVPS